jgi:glycosyltransferase involved in cell wall biosynthesis
MQMKLSIIILCWNDRKVIANCLQSIFERSHTSSFEVIVSDNGSTDGSVDFIRENYPQVRIIENG